MGACVCRVYDECGALVRACIPAVLWASLAVSALAQPYTAKYLPKPVQAWTKDGQEVRGYTLDQMKSLLSLDAEHDYLKSEVLRLREVHGLQTDRLRLSAKERLLDAKLRVQYEQRIKLLEEKALGLEKERNHYKSRPRLAASWRTPLFLGILSLVAGGLLLR